LARPSLYQLSFWNFLILSLWIITILLIFRPYGTTEAEADSQQEFPNIGSMAIEQLGSKLRISFVSYSPHLQLILPDLGQNHEHKAASGTPPWFLTSFAANPILTDAGPCDFDLPGWDYKAERLSLQVIAFCKAPLQNWRWDLSFLLGPLSHGRLQIILVDQESSDVVELSGRQLRLKTRPLDVVNTTANEEVLKRDAG